MRKLVAEIEADRRSFKDFRVAVDEGGQLAGRVDLEELRRLVLALGKIDGTILLRTALVKHPLGDYRATLRIVVKLHDITFPSKPRFGVVLVVLKVSKLNGVKSTRQENFLGDLLLAAGDA